MKLLPGHFRKTVTAAGTQEPLSATAVLATDLIIQALSGNTGVVYVGSSTVSSSDCMAELSAGGVVTFSSLAAVSGGHINLADIYIDVETSGEGVNIGYFTEGRGM